MAEKNRSRLAQDDRVETARKARFILPGWWKAVIYGGSIYSTAGGGIYISGLWQQGLYACTIKNTALDEFMQISVMGAGAFAVFAIFAAFTMIERG